MLNIKLFLFFILLITPYASADITINNTNFVFVTSTGNISFNCIQTLDSFNFTDPNLVYVINGTTGGLNTIGNVSICVSYLINNYNVNINSTNATVTYQTQTGLTNAVYTFFTNSIQIQNQATDSVGILTNVVVVTTNNTYQWIIANTYVTTKTTVCNSNNATMGVTFKLFSLLIMILAFGVIMLQLRSDQPNGVVIIVGIIVGIIGFGLLLLGNYLLNAIMMVTC